MNKKRYILSSLGALSLFNVVTNGIREQHFTQQPLNIGVQPQPLNIGVPPQPVNIGMNQKVLTGTGQKQQEQKGGLNVAGYAAATVSGSLLGFLTGSLVQNHVDIKNRTALENEIQTLKEQNSEAQGKIKNLYDKNKNSDTQIDNLEKKIEKLNDKIKEQDNKIKILEDDDKNEAIARLQNELETQKDENKTLDNALGYARDIVYTLARVCNSVNKGIDGIVDINVSSNAALVGYYLRLLYAKLGGKNSLVNEPPAEYDFYITERDLISNLNYIYGKASHNGIGVMVDKKMRKDLSNLPWSIRQKLLLDKKITNDDLDP